MNNFNFKNKVKLLEYIIRKLILHFKFQYTDTVYYLLKVTGYQM